jgi:hypothetical protein
MLKQEFPELKDGVKAVFGLQVAIMEVLDVGGIDLSKSHV